MVKRLIGVVIITALVLVGLAGAARATVSGDKVGLIMSRCQSVKTSIKQMQKRDAQTRVNLGRNYEYVLSKLMTSMNSRLAANNKYAGDLLSIAASFSENLGYFKKNYVIYDQRITKILNIDCVSRPQEFYEELEKARRDRFEVRYNYSKLQEIIDEYLVELEVVRGKL